MISLDLKPDTKTASKLVLPKDTPTSTLSFASYLHGKQNQKEDLKIAQNGALVLSLKEESTHDEKTKSTKNSSSILSLLKSDDPKALKEEIQSLELNPEITKDKTVAELKVIIQEAKQYLKNKITSLEGFKKSEIAALPKTLKGLTQVAKKLGIDISKVTLEEVKQTVSKPIVKQDEKTLPSKGEQDVSTKNTKTIKTASTTATKTSQEDKSSITQVKEQVKTEQKEQVAVKQTPLFKAQSKPAELTTQEIVSTKIETNESKKPQKQKSENTLELLLRGNKTLKNEGMTADFSVATAKVIAPTMPKEKEQSLEALLNGDAVSEASHSKSDGIHVNKADSFEVKINEAKQMVKYLSNDIKQAIEDYKAPFTRVKVQLNPQKLGEIDLTVVQRGKNLHINLSSNNAAINTLAMNANDLKVQLNNSGIQNASLNFSNMSQGDQSNQNSHAHQQQQNHKNAQEEYGFYLNEEANEEIVNSLEIVVPHYA